ncbi:hypothetical protein ACYOEI_38950, partial [Singulisphaera rosea]
MSFELVGDPRMGYIIATSRPISTPNAPGLSSDVSGRIKGRPMLEGCQSWRGRAGLAWMLLITALAAGCEQLPMPRPNVVPIHVPNPVDATAGPDKDPHADSVPLSQPAEPLPPLPKGGSSDDSATTATPLLDEALMQAELIKHIDTTSEPEPAEDHHASEKTGVPKPPSSDAEAKPIEVALNTVPTAATPSKDHTNAPASIDPEKPTPEPPTPRERWNKGLERLRSLVHEREGSPDAASG